MASQAKSPDRKEKPLWLPVARLILVLTLSFIGGLWARSYISRGGMGLVMEQVDASKRHFKTEFGATDEQGEVVFSWDRDNWAAGIAEVPYRSWNYDGKKIDAADHDQIKEMSKLPSLIGRLGFAYAYHPWANILWIMIPYWAFFVMAGAILFVVWRRIRKIQRRRDDAECSKCGYDLRAHRAGDKCPECGTFLIGCNPS